MKRWVGIVVGVVALLLVALIALAYFLPKTQLVQQYKGQIEDQLSEQLGTKVALNGEVGFSVIPRLGISIRDVVIKNPIPYDGDLARVGRLKVEVKVLPLLRKEVQTGKIQIDTPFIDYRVAEDGVSNIQPILDKFSQQSESSEEQSTSAENSIAIAINGLDIRDGEIHYTDLKNQQQFDFTNVGLALGNFDFNSRSPLQLGFNVRSNLFEPEVRTQLESYLRINLSRQQFFLDENTISLDDARSTALVKANLIALDLNAQQLVADSLSLSTKRGTFALEGGIERIESSQAFDVFSLAGIEADLAEERGTAKAVIDAAHYTLSSGNILATGAHVDAKAPQGTATITIANVEGNIGNQNVIVANNIDGAVMVGDLPYDVTIPSANIDLNTIEINAPQYALSNNVSQAEGSLSITVGDVLKGRGELSVSASEIKRIVNAAIGENIDGLDALESANVTGSWLVDGPNIAVQVKEGAINNTEFSSSIQANYQDMTGDVAIHLGDIVVDDYIPQTAVSTGEKEVAAKGEFVLPVVPTGFTLQIKANEVVYKAQDLRIEDLGIFAVPTSGTSADVRIEGHIDIPGQKELIASSISASVNQSQDLLSLLNIDASARNSQISAEVKGQSLDVEMASGDMRIKAPDINFDMGDLKANLKAPAFLYSMNSANMSLNDLAGQVSNGAIDASVNIASLNGNLNSQSVQSQSATVRFTGDVEADLGLQNVNLNMQEGTLEVGRIQMSGDSGQLDGQATINHFTNLLKAQADITLKGDNLNIPLLAEQFGASFKPAGEGALTNAAIDLAGRFSLNEIQLERGQFASDGGVINATVSTNEGIREINLNASDVNFTDWLPAESGEATSSSSSQNASKAAVSPLALFLTDRSHGSVTLSNVVIAGARLDAVDAAINVLGQDITLSPVNVTLYGGTSTANLHYNYGSGALKFTDALTQLALGDLLKDMEITSIFEGTGSMQFDGEAIGGNEPILNRLKGQGRLSINDGQILGINFKKILVNGYSLYKKNKGQDYSYEGDVDDATQFASLTSDILLDGGIANTNNIQLVAPTLRVVGDGNFDLNKQQLDYHFTAFVDKDFDGQGSEVDLASMSKGIPISIKGSVTSPKIRVDLGALAKQEVDKVVDKELNRAAQKAADKLGGDSAKILDSILGTSISKEEEPEAPQQSKSETDTTPTDTPAPQPNVESNTTTEEPPVPEPDEPLDLRKEAEERLKNEAGKLLEGLFN